MYSLRVCNVSLLLKSIEEALHKQHSEEMKGQTIAHKTLMETVRRQAEKLRESDMKNLKAQHQQDKGGGEKKGS